MTYAKHRRIIDADSHVIELDDFLQNAANKEDKKLLPKMSEQKELPVIQAGLDRGRELFLKRSRQGQAQNHPILRAKHPMPRAKHPPPRAKHLEPDPGFHMPEDTSTF